MSAAWGACRFRGGATWDEEYFAFGWNSSYIFLKYKDAATLVHIDRIDVNASIVMPTEVEVTIVFRGMSYAPESAEVDYYAISVDLDGQQVLFAIVNPTWTPGSKLRFCAYDTDGDAFFSKIRIAELTEFVEDIAVDYGQPLMSSLQQVISGRPIEMIPRFDGSIHFRRIGVETPAYEFQPGDVGGFTSSYDRRLAKTHFRIEGAYEEIDYIDKDLVNDGYGGRFQLIKNENLMTLEDIEREGPGLINLEFERAYQATINVRGNPVLEVGDQIVYDLMHPRIIASDFGGVLTYPSDSRFQDTWIEQDGDNIPWYRYQATAAPAWMVIIITNVDGSTCWGYIGMGGAAASFWCEICQDAALTNAGFNGDTAQPNSDGKTPSSYKIKRAGIWVIEQLSHQVKPGSYRQQITCRGYDRRRS